MYSFVSLRRQEKADCTARWTSVTALKPALKTNLAEDVLGAICGVNNRLILSIPHLVADGPVSSSEGEHGVM